MKTILGALLVLCLTPLLTATVYAFRCTNWPVPVEGYLDIGVGGHDGIGAMYVAGQDQHWRLTGYDSWWHGPFLDQGGFHQCLVIHPVKPWIMGLLYWSGATGRMDIFSANGERFEFDFSVEVLFGGPRDDQRSG